MKANRIGVRINEKMLDWLRSLPADIAAYVRPNIVVTGGAITSMFLGERVNDFDVYFKNIKTVLMVSNHYIKEWAATGNYTPMLRLTFSKTTSKIEECAEKGLYDAVSGNLRTVTNFDSPLVKLLLEDATGYHLNNLIRVEVFVKSSGTVGENPDDADDVTEVDNTSDYQTNVDADTDENKPKYKPVFMSSNAITLSNKVQLVLRFFGDPEKIHETYDFVHATNYWTYNDGLVTNARALEAILAKELHYSGSKYPLASIFRTRKFIKRGWNCHIGNFVKMAMQLNELDLSDVHVLEEQLTGVDAAYLHGIIRAVKDASEKPDFDMTQISGYVCELCDRMMGEGRDGNKEDTDD